jgi:hypothetical protein
VSAPFLLCDPGLLLVPDVDDGANGPLFWTRLIGWSADRRLRLGPESHALVLRHIEDHGWPRLFEPPACPNSLQRLARRGLSVLLSQVAVPSQSRQDGAPPTLRPAYVADRRAAPAIGCDAANLEDEGLIGLATSAEHWSEPANAIAVAPPPPAELFVALVPKQQLACERNAAVASHLCNKRLTIIGGLRDPALLEAWCERFQIDVDQVRWLEAEKGHRLSLEALNGLRATVDIVYCVTGRIGHAGSTSARKKCVKRGIEMRCIAQANAVADDLVDRHGRATG